jgi:lipoyl(octanoyl) transferase
MTPAPELPGLAVVDLGICGYHEAWQQQLALVEARKHDGGGVDTLLLVEHPHVITVGRSQKALANVVAADGVEVVSVERGGDVTYHGPGQIVAYPIVLLREGERDLHRFLRNLEEAAIATCGAFGLDAGREPGKTGVWLDGASGSRKKICSIGVACRRWVTFHGLALNVSTDLSYFFRINPCGFESSVMTSMAEELGAGLAMIDVKQRLARELATTLGRRLL